MDEFEKGEPEDWWDEDIGCDFSPTEDEVVKGMWTEVGWFEKFGVFNVISENDAKGAKHLSTRWVRRDDPDGSVRMRFCAREFKQGNCREDLYTPCSSATCDCLVDIIATKLQWSVFVIDAKNAY